MSKKITLPKLFRTKWLKALRSGRYKQTTGQLHDGIPEHSYCCLGVAGRVCRIPARQLIGGVPGDANVHREHPYRVIFRGKMSLVNPLIKQNDSLGKNFKEIADYIEAKTVGV